MVAHLARGGKCARFSLGRAGAGRCQDEASGETGADRAAWKTTAGSSVGDPMDPETLQCAGLDATVPEVIRGFVSGAF